MAAAIVIALGAGAYFYWYAGGETQPAYREVSVSRGDLELTILSTGVVQPRNRLEIKPPIAGRAEQVLVQEGQHVTKGQIMAWMSSTERAALIDAARARGPEELKRWEELYRATPVLAPINGTVILRSVEPGQTFTGNDAVFVMSDRLTVKAQVDETDIAQIRLRQPAQLVLDAYPDQPFAGHGGPDRLRRQDREQRHDLRDRRAAREIPPFMRSGMTANVSFRDGFAPGRAAGAERGGEVSATAMPMCCLPPAQAERRRASRKTDQDRGIERRQAHRGRSRRMERRREAAGGGRLRTGRRRRQRLSQPAACRSAAETQK